MNVSIHFNGQLCLHAKEIKYEFSYWCLSYENGIRGYSVATGTIINVPKES